MSPKEHSIPQFFLEHALAGAQRGNACAGGGGGRTMEMAGAIKLDSRLGAESNLTALSVDHHHYRTNLILTFALEQQRRRRQFRFGTPTAPT
jgi:hypothetical protein